MLGCHSYLMCKCSQGGLTPADQLTLYTGRVQACLGSAAPICWGEGGHTGHFLNREGDQEEPNKIAKLS